jgi:hypothetical protein
MKSVDHGECICQSRQTVIRLMFWNYVGMFLNVFFRSLELATKKMQYQLVFFIVTLCRC